VTATGTADVVDAYVWGYPLVTMHRTCAAHGGVGRGLVARDRLATAADRAVVGPNNDTLYASGWFDLRAGDVTIAVDAMDTPDRYWSVMVLDAYTHVSYVCRRLHGSAGATVRLTYEPAAAASASDVLAVGTPTVWVLARVLVAGPADLEAARGALGRIAVGQAGGGDTVARPAPAGGFFTELRAALALDPPAVWHPPPPRGLRALLDDLPDADVLRAATHDGRDRIAASMGVDRTGNGWGTRSRGADFGDDVAYRAAFARVSLAGHLPAENRSYRRSFDGSTRAELRFPPGTEPPVDGFWSLCVYGPDLFFVANEIDRYSIGDRTPGLRRDPDGALTITVGHERPAEAANWLPTPPGPCVLVLRAYEGRPDVVAARWFPPDLVPSP
jgi:hypothetical protein